jgi:hypothetical protein
MNTDTPKKPVTLVTPVTLTPEQKARKNELARARRARNKQEVIDIPDYQTEEEIVSNEVEEDVPTLTNEELSPSDVPTKEELRKREIAEKRRASLALARSKIKPKSQIKKEKDDEIQKIMEENARLKEEAERIKTAPQPNPPKVIKKIIREKPKKRSDNTAQKEPSLDYLTQQTYAEQLQAKLRENMLQRVMFDTFM